MIDWLLIVFAYLMGSISSAIIVCRCMGLPDPRGQGSGNPGATNVMRIGGKKAAAITLAGDMLKGLLPVLAAKLLGVSPLILALVGLGAFLGHLYPVFFNFKGGKGVATSFGVLLGYSWLLGLGVAATWLSVFKISKISSLSALVAALLAPFYIWMISGQTELIAAGALISIWLIYRHKSNIKKLLEGTES